MKTVCQTCIHHCRLEPGQAGRCGARKNENGEIVCASYGWITALALDPVEKKPLRRFYPGSMILSAGSYGCNLKCPFCQNHEISMMRPDAGAPAGSGMQKKRRDMIRLLPEQLAQKALELKQKGNIGLAFTYNEPLAGWEYVRDTARIIRQMGMKTVMVTNGTAAPAVLEALLPWIDAMNIDLKGFREDYYEKLGGDLETVKEFIVRAAESCHVELTTLIVPGENDSVEQMREEALWIASIPRVYTDGGTAASGKDIPLHVTRFFPRYRMLDKNASDVQQIYRLAQTAGKYLEHVFVGNC